MDTSVIAKKGFSRKSTSHVDPDVMSHIYNEPSHLDLHCLPWFLNQSAGMKGLT